MACLVSFALGLLLKNGWSIQAITFCQSPGWNFSKAKRGWQKALTTWTNWTNVSAMKTVNVHEAKTNFSSLLATVEDSSESFVICRNGVPVADLVPHQRASRIKAHPILSRIKIKYDPAETASEDEWPKRFR